MAKNKKVRVQLRKNMQSRTRDNDLTGRFHRDELGSAALPSSERVRAKGDLSRRRTIIAEDSGVGGAADDPNEAPRLAVDLDECRPGLVIRVHGLETIVETEDGRRVRCGVRRLLKSIAIDERNVIAAGDRVWFPPSGELQGMIEKVEPRNGIVTRGYRRREHVLAANIDQILIVSAFDEPGVKPSLIDRYLISAERGRVRPVVVLNKADLVTWLHISG